MRRRIKTSSSGVKIEMAGAGFGGQQQASRAPLSSNADQMHPFSSSVRGKSGNAARVAPLLASVRSFDWHSVARGIWRSGIDVALAVRKGALRRLQR
jgi:hypothetical protein